MWPAQLALLQRVTSMKRIFRILRSVAPVLMLLVLVLGIARPAFAEAGRSDRPYRQTVNFKFYGNKEARPLLDKVAALAESHYRQLCGSLGACEYKVGPIDVWLSPNAEALAAEFKGISPMTVCAAGVAFLDESRVILRSEPGASMTVIEAFDHQLAHVFAHAHELADARPVPRWFREGVATRLAGERLFKQLESSLQAAPKKRLSFEELTGQFPERGALVEIAYAQSTLLVKRAIDDGGVDTVVKILKDTGRGTAFDDAFDKRLSKTPADAFKQLERDLDPPKSPSSTSTPWAVMTLAGIVVAWWQLRARKKHLTAQSTRGAASPAEEELAASEYEELPPELAPEKAEPKRD